MFDICSKNKCVGCGVCALICKAHAISMCEDNAGFLYPKINSVKCLNCGLCKQGCPVNMNLSINDVNSAEYYGGSAINQSEVMTSTSGGIASVLSRVVVRNGGVVFGAAYDPFPYVKHIGIENEDEIFKLKGSKYVESDISDALPLVKKALDSKRLVLFIGLPCHIAAVRSYIGKNDENLITIDLICHGKPPQKLFTHWIKYLEATRGKKVISYQFRVKLDSAWNDARTFLHLCVFDNGEKLRLSNEENWYGRYFLGGTTFRESCYNCPFAKLPRVGDITLADFWGVESDERFARMMESGVSLISVQSKQGKRLIESASQLMDLLSVSEDFALRLNRGLNHASRRPLYRKYVYSYLYKSSVILSVCDRLLFGLGRLIRKIRGKRGV